MIIILHIIECACTFWQGPKSLHLWRWEEVRWGRTDQLVSALEKSELQNNWGNMDDKAWPGELLSKDLIESLCQRGGSNQRTCVFQVERDHVESTINPTSWFSIQRLLFSTVGSPHWCSALSNIVPPSPLNTTISLNVTKQAVHWCFSYIQPCYPTN